MGKFLKILRYIPNLIAIMGGCLSKPTNETSDLTQPLLGGQTKGSDFNPDQGVSSIRPPNSPNVEAFLSSHVVSGKNEFGINPSKFDWNEFGSDMSCVFLRGTGNFPRISVNHEQRTVMSLKLVHLLSSKTNVRRTPTGFVVDIGGISYKLENFDLLLKGEISEGDFKEDLVKNNPEDYKQIWDVLTSGGPFLALYY